VPATAGHRRRSRSRQGHGADWGQPSRLTISRRRGAGKGCRPRHRRAGDGGGHDRSWRAAGERGSLGLTL